MTEHEKRIREALEAGPTEGPWFEHHDKGHLYIENQRDDVICDMGLRAKSSPTSQFIAACNPSAIRALLADLDEARAALSAAKAGGWLPIETAPKDGTEMLLLFGNAEYIFGKTHGRVRAACWTGSGASANWSLPYFKDNPPTAWQPLPAPPAQKEPT